MSVQFASMGVQFISNGVQFNSNGVQFISNGVQFYENAGVFENRTWWLWTEMHCWQTTATSLPCIVCHTALVVYTDTHCKQGWEALFTSSYTSCDDLHVGIHALVYTVNSVCVQRIS